MAAFKALKKERKLSKLPWLILSQLSKIFRSLMPNPQPIGTPTARNPYQTRCLTCPSSPEDLNFTRLHQNQPRCSQRHSHEPHRVNPNSHGFLFCYANLSCETHSFSTTPLPSSSDLPIWTHLMLRLEQGCWRKIDAKKKERQKIERKKVVFDV